MPGQGLLKRLVATAVAAGAAFVAIVAMGATIYYALSLALTPLGAAAVTAALFTALALTICMVFLKQADNPDHEDEDEADGLATRALTLFRHRPILAATAALAGGWIFLRNPALATMVAAAFTEKSHGRKRR